MGRANPAKQIILRNMQAPGDILMMTAAVRDLHRCYPGQFITGVESTAPAVWENNPYVTKLNRRSSKIVKLGYPLIHKSNQWGIHFIQGFIDDLNAKLGLKVRLTEFRPDMHWSTDELQKPLVEGPYWLIISGGKADFTTKWWDPSRYQEVVNKLDGKVAFVQIGNKPEGGGARHHHPPLVNTVNLVGKTDLREAFRLLLHARGIITPVTCFMHAAAALGKPAVVVAGGREHWTWEAYNMDTLQRNMAYAAGHIKKPPGTEKEWNRWDPRTDKQWVDHVFWPHTFIHSIGKLSCCKTGGCWKIKVTEGRNEQNCQNVVKKPGRPLLPRCLNDISADDVVRSVLELEDKLDNLQGEHLVPTVNDLIVNLHGGNITPPGPQDDTPVVETPEAPKKEKKKRKDGELPASYNFKHLKFPITIFGLTYGDHGDLAIRCLDSVYKNLDSNLFKLRYAMNEPSKRARAQVLGYLEDKPNVENVYEANPQVYKYPMMRQMFHDPNLPITTDWVMWFDDDSHVVKPEWIDILGESVDAWHTKQDEKGPNGYHMFGKVYYWHLRGDQWNWIKEADWHTGRAHARDTTKNPPMDKSDFCTGGWWLISTKAIKETNWPDVRIKHRGGDIMSGIAMWQKGFGVHQCLNGVKISDAKLRGYNEDIIASK